MEHHPYKTIFAGMLSVALAFAIAIPLGFWLRPRWPALHDAVLAGMVVFVLVGISFAVMRLLAGPLWARNPDTAPGRRPDPDIDPPHTGYEITLDEFRRLISDPLSQPAVAAVLRDWYHYEVAGQGSATAVRSQEGDVVGLRVLHTQIQFDPVRQRSIYGLAMDFWR